MNSVEVQGINEVPCQNQQNNQSKQLGYSQLLYWNKQERTNRKDQPWRRLATKNKIAQKPSYNLPTYQEKRTIAELLNQYGEYAYLTGKRLGNYYLSTLDLDIRKEEFPEKLIERLVKNLACLLDFLKISYDWTKKGLHIDILIPEPLENEIIYYQGWGKKWTIGSIQSLGKYVVGEDPDKTFIQVGKWYWKVKNNEEVKITLNKFFFYLNSQEKTLEKPIEINKEINLNIPKSPITKYTTIHAKILSIWKTKLEQTRKILYLDLKNQQKGYFLLNDYHRKKVNLNLGTTQSILLVNGHRHRFFYRLIPYF